MQKYMYEKAMAQETRNGGTSTLNNNNGVDNSKKKLLIALDIFCLLLGEFMMKFTHDVLMCIFYFFTLNSGSTHRKTVETINILSTTLAF